MCRYAQAKIHTGGFFRPDIKINQSAKLFKWIGSEKILPCIFVGLLSESEKSWGLLGTNLVEVSTGVKPRLSDLRLGYN